MTGGLPSQLAGTGLAKSVLYVYLTIRLPSQMHLTQSEGLTCTVIACRSAINGFHAIALCRRLRPGLSIQPPGCAFKFTAKKDACLCWHGWSGLHGVRPFASPASKVSLYWLISVAGLPSTVDINVDASNFAHIDFTSQTYQVSVQDLKPGLKLKQ